MAMTFASLCCRANRAVDSFQTKAARMPLTLFAAICSPLPEPPMTMPRLGRLSLMSRATPSAAPMQKAG
jgi:hypothetical protein